MVALGHEKESLCHMIKLASMLHKAVINSTVTFIYVLKMTDDFSCTHHGAQDI